MKGRIDPHPLQLCNIIFGRFQSTHSNELAANMRNYKISA
ncbi:hypothetical protein X772_33040 [Mesorhizobium sp. LSJC280B00]|nr:hypothetical protein X772_33040 [Mesorhizobium sp. LSJC280B00]